MLQIGAVWTCTGMRIFQNFFVAVAILLLGIWGCVNMAMVPETTVSMGAGVDIYELEVLDCEMEHLSNGG